MYVTYASRANQEMYSVPQKSLHKKKLNIFKITCSNELMFFYFVRQQLQVFIYKKKFYKYCSNLSSFISIQKRSLFLISKKTLSNVSVVISCISRVILDFKSFKPSTLVL